MGSTSKTPMRLYTPVFFIQFEMLPNFYYKRGLLGHTFDDCEQEGEGGEGHLPYGD